MGRMLYQRAFLCFYLKYPRVFQWYLNLANRRQDVPLTEEKVLVSTDVSFSCHLTPPDHLYAAAGQVAGESLCEWTFLGVSVVPAIPEGISSGGISRGLGGGENCQFDLQQSAVDELINTLLFQVMEDTQKLQSGVETLEHQYSVLGKAMKESLYIKLAHEKGRWTGSKWRVSCSAPCQKMNVQMSKSL